MDAFVYCVPYYVGVMHMFITNKVEQESRAVATKPRDAKYFCPTPSDFFSCYYIHCIKADVNVKL